MDSHQIGSKHKAQGLKYIKLEPAWRLRDTTYSDVYLQHPPAGTKFVYESLVQRNSWALLSRSPATFQIQRFLSEYLPIQLMKSELETHVVRQSGYHLTYAIDHLVLRSEPWVLEMTFELPFILTGSERTLSSFRSLVSKLLMSRNCKAIICQLTKGKEAVLQELGEDLASKTFTIPRAISIPVGRTLSREKRTNDDYAPTILFVNSGNINAPDSFYIKGGHYVVETFLKLRKVWPEARLVVRSSVPQIVRRRLKGILGITLIDRPVSRSEMEVIWNSADIFMHPHFGNLSNVLLEAMAHGLPIVTTDTWATPELVRDGTEGLLVHNQLANTFTEGAVLHFMRPEYVRATRQLDEKMLDELFEQTVTLIQNPSLGTKMGICGFKRISQGINSVETRNKALGDLLNSITSN